MGESKELWALYPIEDNNDYAGIITALSSDAVMTDMMTQYKDAICLHDDGKMILVDRKMITDADDQNGQRFMSLTIKNHSIVWDSLKDVDPGLEIIKNADAIFNLYVETQAMFENDDLSLTTEDLNFGDFDHSMEQ